MPNDPVTEGKRLAILKQGNAALEDICREHEISLATYYGWNSKLGAPEPKRIGVMVIYAGLLLLAVSAMLLSYYLEQKPEPGPFWSHVSRDVGISGLVGFLLAMTFERLSAEEFKRTTRRDRDAIKQDVFYYVLGYHLPFRIRNEIISQIVSSPFLRQSCLMDVELQIIEDPQGRHYMKTTCKLSYEVVNLTPEMKTWSFGPYIDKSPVPSLENEAKFTKVKIEGSQNPIELNEQDLQKPQYRVPDKTTIKVKLPEAVKVETSAKVEVDYQTVRFLEAGHFQYVLSHHALDFEVIVRMVGPSIDPDIEITVEADPARLVKTPQHHPECRFYNWKIKRPLLPYQAITVKWIMKPATSRKGDPENAAPAPTLKPAESNGVETPAPAQQLIEG